MANGEFDVTTESSTVSGANRRIHEREFPRRTSVQLFLGNAWREFQVLDESDGGLGIFSGTCDELERGRIVTVQCETRGSRQAEVRYLAPHPRGGFHVGIMWTDA